MLIFKICGRDEWSAAAAAGTYSGSLDDERDGFIHFSTARQLPGTAQKHFAGREDLVLLAFDADSFSERLKWEASRGGQLFPHFYGTLSTADILWRKQLPLGPDGHILPDLSE